MAKFVLISFSLLLISLSSVCYQGLAADEVKKYYCVANPSTSQTALQANIDYVCDHEKLDCTVIQQGGACSEPFTPLNNRASVAMNIYYQKHKIDGEYTCDFKNNGIKSGLIAITDPSYGNCKYA